MNWLTEIIETYKKGTMYDLLQQSSKDLDRLNNSLEKDYADSIEANKILYEEQKQFTACIFDLEKEIKELREKQDKHSSLENFKKFTNSIPKTPTSYDFGSGKKQVHTIFKESIKDKEIILDFIENDLKFDMNMNWTPDDLVFNFRRQMSVKFPTTKYYANDKELYGQNELWATAKQTIEKTRKGGKAFDCDDMMTLIYSCLYHLIQIYFPEQKWRLRGFIVDLWGNLGGHAMLGWVSSKFNDWIPLETTFMDTEQSTLNKYTIRNQIFYQIRYSFDEQGEYTKI